MIPLRPFSCFASRCGAALVIACGLSAVASAASVFPRGVCSVGYVDTEGIKTTAELPALSVVSPSFITVRDVVSHLAFTAYWSDLDKKFVMIAESWIPNRYGNPVYSLVGFARTESLDGKGKFLLGLVPDAVSKAAFLANTGKELGSASFECEWAPQE